jgi:hypothetical protein
MYLQEGRNMINIVYSNFCLIFNYNILQFLVTKSVDPDPHWDIFLLVKKERKPAHKEKSRC